MNVEVTTRGQVAPELAELARERVSELASAVDRPIVAARVVLREEENPRIPRPSRAEGELRLGGHPVRARVEAETMQQAVTALVERLREQLRRHVDRLTTQQRTPPAPGQGEWQLAAWTPPEPPRSSLPRGRREVRRRKAFALEPMTAWEAAAEMTALDHNFYLFRDADTGADSVVYRRDDGRLAVIAPAEVTPPDGGGDNALVREPSRYPGPLTLDEAVGQMDELDHRFLFFEDAATGRGAVLYLRYDGHYGLLEPAA